MFARFFFSELVKLVQGVCYITGEHGAKGPDAFL